MLIGQDSFQRLTMPNFWRENMDIIRWTFLVVLWYPFLIGLTGCRTALPKAVVVSKSSCCRVKCCSPKLVDVKMINVGFGEFETGNLVGSFSSLTAGKLEPSLFELVWLLNLHIFMWRWIMTSQWSGLVLLFMQSSKSPPVPTHPVWKRSRPSGNCRIIFPNHGLPCVVWVWVLLKICCWVLFARKR